MTYIEYESWTPSAASTQIVAHADRIATDYAGQGYNLTLRQLFYRFVATDLLPNTQRSYKRLGDIVNRGRLAGMISWDHIEDRTRELRALDTWGRPESIMESARSSYREDILADQETRVEVWVEKDALIDVIGRAADRFDVPYFSCRGYVSQSEMWAAGQRIMGHRDQGQDTIILHLGDHDPSGMDMTRDIRDRLEMFCGWGAPRVVERIALNMEQIRSYDPPPNPTKTTDSRAGDYMARYGGDSWELDALEPSVLTSLIGRHLDEIVDTVLLEDARSEQEANRDRIGEAISKMTLDG